MRWLIEQIYHEEDLAKALGTAAAGAVALVTYLYLGDWYIASLAGVVVYPVVRICLDGVAARVRLAGEAKERRRLLDTLSGEELNALEVFVSEGSCSISYQLINHYDCSAGIDSLVARNLAQHSISIGTMQETVEIDEVLYIAGVQAISARD